MKAREVNRLILRLGGVQVRQRGSHRRFTATSGEITCNVTVPQHSGDIPKGTLAAMQRSMEPVFGEGWLSK